MKQLTLEIYFETEAGRDLAERSSDALQRLVAEMAPHIDLRTLLLKARTIRRNSLDWGGRAHEVPSHDPGAAGHQTLLITSEDIGAQGWGWRGSCVVSDAALLAKSTKGGDPADILIHEWLHTLEGVDINGRAVPFADSATAAGFGSTVGPDGEEIWHEWYRFALGG